MSKRETTLAIAIAAMLVLLAGYALVAVPIMNAFDRVAKETAELETQVNEARVLIDNQRTIEGRWASYRTAGLRVDQFDARRRTQESITQWSAASRLSITNLEASGEASRDDDNPFEEITFRLSAKGSILALQRFLEHVSASPFPLRITDCSISNRREGSEELDLSLTLTTIIQPEDLPESIPGGAS